MYDIILILSTALIGLIFSYLIVTVFNVGSDTNDSLRRDVQQMAMQMMTLTVSVVFGPINGVWTTCTSIMTTIINRWKWVLAGILFITATFLQHYYHAEILSVVDDSWTCAVIPFLKNVFEPFLQMIRVLYALGVPILNAFLVVHGQFFKGWYIVLGKCSQVRLFDIFLELGKALIALMMAIGKWFGIEGTLLSDDNNFIVNDFDITSPVEHTMKSVLVFEDALSCACYRFRPIFKTAFFIFSSQHIAPFLDNLFETGIRGGQLLFKLLYAEFPEIYKITFKLERALLELGLLGDEFIFTTLKNFIQLFTQMGDRIIEDDNNQNDQKDEFKFKRYPKEYIFSALAHLAVAAEHAAATIIINGPLTLFASFLPSRSAFNSETWSLEKSLSHVHSAVYTTATSLQWFIYIIEKLVMDTSDIGDVFVSKETPLHLACNWASDVDEKKYVALSYTVGCSYYYYGIMMANLAYIAYGASIEIATKSIFTQEQNVFRTLQRWEGSSIARNEVVTCEQRKQMLAYDYFDSNAETAYYPDGYIWTQNRGACQCDIYYGKTRNETQLDYNPWCGQPNLNFDVFAPADAFIMHVSHGLFGPGFGDAIPFIPPTQNIHISIKTFDKTIPLPIVIPPMTRTVVESARVLLRMVFSFGDIVTGHYFNYPVNCGHGMNETQLIAKWVAETGKEVPEHSPDEMMRWYPCIKRQYSAMINNKRMEICSSSTGNANEKKDCMCSYMQALDKKSNCRCIARYPDLDVTSSSAEVGDLIEERFTSESVSRHWCNSMTLEWTFQNAAAFTDALDYIVSLGPINPKCSLIDDLIKDKGMTFGEEDQRQESVYLLATTPTLRFMSEFADSDLTMNHLTDLYGEGESECTVQEGEWKEVNDPNSVGGTIRVWQDPEWSCDDSKQFVSLSELQGKREKDDTLENPGCRIWARKDFFCSTGLFVRNSARLSGNLARQVINDGIAIISGNFADVNLNILPRVCDYERIWGALAGMVAGIIPGLPEKIKEVFAKYLTMIAQTLFVTIIRIGVALYNIAFNIVESIVDKTFSKSSVKEAFKTAINTIVDSLLWTIRYFFKTTGEFLNEITAGSGKLCLDIVKIIDMISERLANGLMDLFGIAIEMIFQLFGIFTGKTDLIDDFFENFFFFWVEIAKILISEVWKILNKIYDFFGPIGDFLKILTWAICNAINAVMGAIDSAIKALCLGLCDGIGWDTMECVNPLGQTHQGFGRLSKHMLQARDNQNLTARVADVLDWSGTSKCDHFMEAAAEYAYSDLRPLEKAQWIECLEFKLIGVEMGKLFESKNFPSDIVYNWKRKYIMVYELVRTIKIVIDDFLVKGTFDWPSIRVLLYDEGLDADMYMLMFQKLLSMSSSIVHNIEIEPVFRNMLHHADKNYDNPENPSMASHTWTLYKNINSMVVDTSKTWMEEDMTQSMWKMVDASYDAHRNTMHWWSSLGTEENPTQTETERIIGRLKSGFKYHWSENIQHHQLHKHAQKPIHWLKRPLRVSINRCANRTSRFKSSCVDCAILDNLIETILIQADGISSFYKDNSITKKREIDFPFILTNVSSYFDELAEYNSDFFEAQFSKLENVENAPIPKTSIRWEYHVVNDWKYLFSNFSEFIVDWNNETCQNNIDREIRKFINSTRLFVSSSKDTYVPFYAYSFYHMYNYLLFNTCDLDATLFVTTTTQDERLEKIDTALIVCAIVIFLLVTNASWSILPLIWLANTIVIGIIVNFIYLYIVYDYMITCAPIIPYTLVEDIYAWYSTRINPGCFYHVLPHLSTDATDDTCLTCSTPPIYKDCTVYTAANFTEGMLPLQDLISDYNIFWPQLFWIRWKVPELATWFVKNAVVDLDTTIGKLALSAWQNEPIDPIWIDCFYAMWLDNILAGFAVAIVSYIIFKIVTIAIQTSIRVGILIMYTYQTLSLVSETVEDYNLRECFLVKYVLFPFIYDHFFFSSCYEHLACYTQSI